MSVTNFFSAKLAVGLVFILAVGWLLGVGLLPSSQNLVRAAHLKTTNLQRVALGDPDISSQSARIGGSSLQIAGEATVIAPTSPITSEQFEINAPDNRHTSIYVVRDGDTLSEIAELFDVSVNTIVWANNLAGKTIHPGDTLVILPMTGIRHTVQEGETLSEIADRYDVSVETIRDYNNLEEDATLAVGAILDIPGGEMPEPETTNTAPSQPSEPTLVVANSGQAVVQESRVSTSHGYYINPVPGAIMTQSLHGYNAVDLGIPIGTSVVAAASGEVITSVASGWNGGYGRFVVIRHPNGTKTLYAHLSAVVVTRGQHVVQGQVVGYSGTSGNSTGPHLHFEVRGAVNPLVSSCVVGAPCY